MKDTKSGVTNHCFNILALIIAHVSILTEIFTFSYSLGLLFSTILLHSLRYKLKGFQGFLELCLSLGIHNNFLTLSAYVVAFKFPSL
jgi:hypothetical protein